jgi:hypothetical protein
MGLYASSGRDGWRAGEARAARDLRNCGEREGIGSKVVMMARRSGI